MSKSNNSRIAKNTLFLYFRMLLIMIVTLYTSRVILQVLGATDFGIYNVVGGVVTMLAFFNSSLSTATQRYLNFEMGKGNENNLQKIFSMSFIGFCIIAVITVILAETLGLWFVYNKLTIPTERMNAAIMVYHFSVMTFVVSILMIPYNATIIAREKMSIYAYISIIEVILKLLLVFLLQELSYDKLVIYGLMMFFVSCSIVFFYRYYCLKNFYECKLLWIWDKNLLKGLFSFSGWMLSGTITNMLSTQGINILINMYFGPTMNAARAIAMQVNGAVSSFSANFMTAVRPQIIKSYAEGDLIYMYKLVFSASKISFFLLFIFILPILQNTDEILSLWLKDVPSFAILFTKLILVDLLINSAYGPIAYVSQASGKIRDYQLVISICFLSILIFSWIAYKLGYSVETSFYIAIIIDIIGLFLRLLVLSHISNFPVYSYFIKVIFPVLCVFGVSLSMLHIVFLNFFINGIIGLFLRSLLCFTISICSILFIGLNQNEKRLLIKGFSNIFNRIKL